MFFLVSAVYGVWISSALLFGYLILFPVKRWDAPIRDGSSPRQRNSQRCWRACPQSGTGNPLHLRSDSADKTKQKQKQKKLWISRNQQQISFAWSMKKCPYKEKKEKNQIIIIIIKEISSICLVTGYGSIRSLKHSDREFKLLLRDRHTAICSLFSFFSVHCRLKTTLLKCLIWTPAIWSGCNNASRPSRSLTARWLPHWTHHNDQPSRSPWLA